MAKRYSKFHSNFILKKRHQNIANGTIWERDWVTIGTQQQIERGKRPYHFHGNFLFTDNTIASYKKRHHFGERIAQWTYDDVKDAKRNEINVVEVNRQSEDIRDYAYFGSCLELVKTSIINIVKNFPGRLVATNEHRTLGGRTTPAGTDETENTTESENNNEVVSLGYVINNDFNINLFSANIGDDGAANKLRYMVYSWDKYQVDGVDIKDYKVETHWELIDCENNFWKRIIEIFITIDKIVFDNTLGDTRNAVIHISGYNDYDGTIKYFKEDDSDNFKIIQPKEEVINDYFDNIDPFEKVLLNRKTNPLYSVTLVEPDENEYGYTYSKKTYTWPSEDYCIVVNGSSYDSYVSRIIDCSQRMDEIWCDNLWARMTHEAIKNYDWTYTREFVDGEETEFIIGGNRIEDIIRIYGRIFDDIKRYVDGIKISSVITYDGDNNMPLAEISDRLNYKGWDVFSTIPLFEDNDNVNDVSLDERFFNLCVTKKNQTTFLRWFNTLNPEMYGTVEMDTEFLRALSLSSKYILSSKGTINAIEMIMSLFGIGNDEYHIEERYYYTYPKERDAYYENRIYQLTGDTIGDETKLYNGVPLKNVELYRNLYTVPYIEEGKDYLQENTYFQSKGGWCKKGIDGNSFDYIETFSYLRSVATISELLSLNPFSLSEGEVVYVISINDYAAYNEYVPEDITNFFILDDAYNPHLFASWHYVCVDENSVDFNPLEYERVMYLTNIVSTSIGNNPHVGFGNYDDGQTYVDRMALPLGYYAYSSGDDSNSDLVDSLTYDVNTVNTDSMDGKIKVIADTYSYNAYYVDDYGNTVPENTSWSEDYHSIYYSPVLGELTTEEYDNLEDESLKESYELAFKNESKNHIITSFEYFALPSKSNFRYEISKTKSVSKFSDKDDVNTIYNIAYDSMSANTTDVVDMKYVHILKQSEYDALSEDDQKKFMLYCYQVMEEADDTEITKDDYDELPVILHEIYQPSQYVIKESISEEDYNYLSLFWDDISSYYKFVEGAPASITIEGDDNVYIRNNFVDREVNGIWYYGWSPGDVQEPTLCVFTKTETPSVPYETSVISANPGEEGEMIYSPLVTSYTAAYTPATEGYVFRPEMEAYRVIDVDTYNELNEYMQTVYNIQTYDLVPQIDVSLYDDINDMDYEAIESNEPIYLETQVYYLNSKVLVFTNNINSDAYKKYFFDVIIHYVMQVIPSTTIVILENFT